MLFNRALPTPSEASRPCNSYPSLSKDSLGRVYHFRFTVLCWSVPSLFLRIKSSSTVLLHEQGTSCVQMHPPSWVVLGTQERALLCSLSLFMGTEAHARALA